MDSVAGRSTPAPAEPGARRKRFGRLIKRAGIVLVLVYLLGGVVLYFMQNTLVFPGSWTQSSASAKFQTQAGERLAALTTKSGERIVALHALATNPDGSVREDHPQRPTVLYFYGNGENISLALPQIRDLSRRGFNVLTPEFVGYGLSGGRPSEQGIYDTADAAYEYLVETHGVRPEKLVIAGRSLGAAAAVYLTSRRPAAGLATFSAFTTINEVAQHLGKVYPVGLLMRCRFDNLSKIPEVDVPIFIAHGSRDWVIPFEHSLRLADATNSPTHVEIPKAGHDGIFRVGGEKLVDDFAEFVIRATGIAEPL